MSRRNSFLMPLALESIDSVVGRRETRVPFEIAEHLL
jgi:hypothetical protein